MFGGADPTIPISCRPTSRSAATTSSKPLRLEVATRRSRHRVDRQEPLRAEERSPRARRRQCLREQLGRRRRTASRSSSPCATRTAARRGRSSRTSPSRTTRSPLAAGMNILGRDDNHPSQPTQRIMIRNNLFVDIGGPAGAAAGDCFQLIDGTQPSSSITTRRSTPATSSPPRGRPIARLRLHQQHRRAQRVWHRRHRCQDRHAGPDALFPGAVVRRNVIVGASSAQPIPRQLLRRLLGAGKFEDLSFRAGLAWPRAAPSDAPAWTRCDLLGVDITRCGESVRPGGDGGR